MKNRNKDNEKGIPVSFAKLVSLCSSIFSIIFFRIFRRSVNSISNKAKGGKAFAVFSSRNSVKYLNLLEVKEINR